MKKVKSIMIVLLSVMVVGCSNKNNEQQEDSSIAIEQQTEGESQSIQSTDISKENETPVATDNIVEYSEYFQGISGCAVIYDESSNTYSFITKRNVKRKFHHCQHSRLYLHWQVWKIMCLKMKLLQWNITV